MKNKPHFPPERHFPHHPEFLSWKSSRTKCQLRAILPKQFHFLVPFLRFCNCAGNEWPFVKMELWLMVRFHLAREPDRVWGERKKGSVGREKRQRGGWPSRGSCGKMRSAPAAALIRRHVAWKLSHLRARPPTKAASAVNIAPKTIRAPSVELVRRLARVNHADKGLSRQPRLTRPEL